MEWRHTMNIDKQHLITFLCEAKRDTYVAENKGEIKSNVQDFSYKKGSLKYSNTCIGTEQIVGEEVLWQGDAPVWAMNYTGREVAEGFDITFLREALRRIKEDLPYRGPRYLELGEYTYKCRVEGEFEWFVGCEKILCRGKKVYEAMFQGGVVK